MTALKQRVLERGPIHTVRLDFLKSTRRLDQHELGVQRRIGDRIDHQAAALDVLAREVDDAHGSERGVRSAGHPSDAEV